MTITPAIIFVVLDPEKSLFTSTEKTKYIQFTPAQILPEIYNVLQDYLQYNWQF